MSQVPADPDVTIECAVTLFLHERLHRSDFLARIDPWRRLVEKPVWRNAKPLLEVDPAFVSRIVEGCVAGSTGSRDPTEWLCLGKVRAALDNHAGALDAYRYLTERDDRNYMAFYNAALSHIALGNMADADAALRRVLEIRPHDTRAIRVIRAHLPHLAATLVEEDEEAPGAAP